MSAQSPCDCGCCSGVHPRTPGAVENRSGLSAIAYRIGTHARFRDSLLAGITSSPTPLTRLKSRDTDDFSIALIDAWACVADVLTFYQERIANESYLRTATETLSLVELARLIGYELQPGVAASAWLAFTVDEAEGGPEAATVPRGSRVQSIPGQDEEPQTFETDADLDARRAWNTLRPWTTEVQAPEIDDQAAYIAGVESDLQAGNTLLVIGTSESHLARVTSVVTEAEESRTRVEWSDKQKLDEKVTHPQPALYAMRVRASLFAHNAPDRRALRKEEADQIEAATPLQAGDPIGTQYDWKFPLASPVPLDNVYPTIHDDSWLAILGSELHLYRVQSTTESGLTQYTVSGKSTEVTLGTNVDLGPFNGADNYRSTSVFAASEFLPLTEKPVEGPLKDAPLSLDRRVEDLPRGRALLVRGKAIRLTAKTGPGMAFTPDNGAPKTLLPGQVVTLTGALREIDPQLATALAGDFVARARDVNGVAGQVTFDKGSERWLPARDEDPFLTELAIIDTADTLEDSAHTLIELKAPLRHAYDPNTVSIYGNVAGATHGESVREVLGSGDGTEAFQRFTLKQPPLTHVSARTERGTASTLSLLVNDTRWSELPTLHGAAPTDRAYITRRDSEGRTTVQFGDGISGSRLPSGSNNVRAEYRKGIGRAGLVRAGQLALLTTQPFGISDVINPLPSEGARDAESLADARGNAPRTVLTLDRVVSLLDYQNFARSFGSIAKSLATWTRAGAQPVVFLTVAGQNGAPVDPAGALHRDLAAALRRFGNPNVPLRIASYRPAFFRIHARVGIAPGRVATKVMAAVKAALQSAFSFEARDFAQAVDRSEVFAVIQRVDGVAYVDVDRFFRAGAGEDVPRLLASPAKQLDDGTLVAAELLTLDAWDQQDVKELA